MVAAFFVFLPVATDLEERQHDNEDFSQH